MYHPYQQLTDQHDNAAARPPRASISAISPNDKKRRKLADLIKAQAEFSTLQKIPNKSRTPEQQARMELLNKAIAHATTHELLALMQPTLISSLSAIFPNYLMEMVDLNFDQIIENFKVGGPLPLDTATTAKTLQKAWIQIQSPLHKFARSQEIAIPPLLNLPAIEAALHHIKQHPEVITALEELFKAPASSPNSVWQWHHFNPGRRDPFQAQRVSPLYEIDRNGWAHSSSSINDSPRAHAPRRYPGISRSPLFFTVLSGTVLLLSNVLVWAPTFRQDEPRPGRNRTSNMVDQFGTIIGETIWGFLTLISLIALGYSYFSRVHNWLCCHKPKAHWLTQADIQCIGPSLTNLHAALSQILEKHPSHSRFITYLRPDVRSFIEQFLLWTKHAVFFNPPPVSESLAAAVPLPPAAAAVPPFEHRINIELIDENEIKMPPPIGSIN
jgi:hypothetical protein